MTFPSSRRAGVVQGPQHAATGPEPSSGVGPALHADEPEPPLRSYLELGALPTAVPCARLHARQLLWEWGMNELASPDAAGETQRYAAAATALIHALLRHYPVPGNGGEVATAAGLQFLALNGWQADMDVPPAAAIIIQRLASGS